MAICFDIKCEKCGSEELVVSDYLSIRLGNKDILLPHPGEEEKLQEYGYTKEKSALEGKLIQNEGYACNDCGGITFIKSLVLPDIGFLGTKKSNLLFLPILSFSILFPIFTDYNIFYMQLFVLAIMAILYIPVRKYVIQQNTLKKHGFQNKQECRNCKSENIIQIGTYLIKKKCLLLCDKCGERRRHCEEVVMS